MRRYLVLAEDILSGADYVVGRCWTRKGMYRRVRRLNGRVRAPGMRFVGVVDPHRV